MLAVALLDSTSLSSWLHVLNYDLLHANTFWCSCSQWAQAWRASQRTLLISISSTATSNSTGKSTASVNCPSRTYCIFCQELFLWTYYSICVQFEHHLLDPFWWHQTQGQPIQSCNHAIHHLWRAERHSAIFSIHNVLHMQFYSLMDLLQISQCKTTDTQADNGTDANMITEKSTGNSWH